MAGDDEILSALAPLNAEQTLGRYELLTPIGRGGMAVVWAARLRGSRGFSKMVAIKVMLPHLSVDPRFERMFLREAKIASRIRHPNVCEITDLGEQDGLLYLVMQWVDGDSLATVMRASDEALPYDVAAHIAAETGRGLQAAHELTAEDGEKLDVVHRDVSPQNILVTAGGAVQIVDFGVAKAANDGEQTTQSGFTKGKVGYVAPEQVNGSPVDARTDVFALGVVLYELTTRQHPFRRATDLATLLAVASTDPLRDPRAIDPSYPPELAAIVTRAVEKDPEARFATMAEMVAALDAFVEQERRPEDIGERTRAVLTQLLADSAERRAQRLRDAEAAFERRRNDRSRGRAASGGVRSRRSAIVVGSVVVGALVVGAVVGMRLRLGNERRIVDVPPASAASAPSPIPEIVPAPETSSAATTVAAPPPIASSAPPVARKSTPVNPRQTTPSASAPVRSAAPVLSPPAASSGPRFRDPGF